MLIYAFIKSIPNKIESIDLDILKLHV